MLVFEVPAFLAGFAIGRDGSNWFWLGAFNAIARDGNLLISRGQVLNCHSSRGKYISGC